MQPTIGIIGGNGRMGRLFADFFKDRGLTVLVSDIGTKLSNRDLAARCDITIVAVPIDKTEAVIKNIAKHVPQNSALMDFTSVKEMPIKAMLKADAEVTGLHPMFGNSNPIPGQTVIFCETPKSGKWTKWFRDFLAANNVKIQNLTPRKHDEIMNIAQGLIHFADIAFADALRRTKMSPKELFKFTGKASELKVLLAARLIDQDPELYGNIQIRNPQALKSLTHFKKSVDELIKIVKRKDLKAFTKYFNDCGKYFGAYSKEAYNDSSFLIDQLIGLHSHSLPEPKTAKPSLKHIALLGPRNTFSDIAATQYLKHADSKLEKYFTKDIDEVFDLVADGKVKEGIVPVENKLNGSIRETLDGLFFKNVHITRELNIPIHHSLITLDTAKKSDIRKIISHPQALNQCKKFLQKNFPKAEYVANPSTGAAIETLLKSKDKTVAVIAPEIAADRPGLRIFAKRIEDSNDNTTTFIVISQGPSKERDTAHGKERKKTSIAFHFDADSPGSLFTVFKDFAETKVNMSKIESRPTRSSFGDYIFFLDFDGSTSDLKIKKLLKSVEKKVAKLKILGSY